MEKLDKYRQIVKAFLNSYVSVPIASESIESYTVFDVSEDRYLVMSVGWKENRRVYGCVLHLDIKDGRIWLQQNSTEIRVGHELVEMGVAREDIVLGFQPPALRQYTEFATA